MDSLPSMPELPAAAYRVNGKRSEISLKRSIAYDTWDSGKGKAKGTKAEAKTLNLYLDNVKSRLLECQETLLKEKKWLHPKPSKIFMQELMSVNIAYSNSSNTTTMT